MTLAKKYNWYLSFSEPYFPEESLCNVERQGIEIQRGEDTKVALCSAIALTPLTFKR